MIPLYKAALSSEEMFSIETTVSTLNAHDIFLIGPEALEPTLNQLATSLSPSVRPKVYAGKYFVSIEGYNALMRSRLFYTSFLDYDFILIVQPDALVFSDQIDFWCHKNYAYIGAPWFVGLNRPKKPLSFLGVGNGGLSLRRVKDFLQVLAIPRYVPNLILSDEEPNSTLTKLAQVVKHKLVFAYNFGPLFPRINEDFFWGLLVPRVCPFFKVPAAEEAASFAFEREPRYLYEFTGRRLPFGCHGWEKYDAEFWRSLLKIERA